MSSFINWFIDSMASEDVIDLYFILSDMVEIDIGVEEHAERGHLDATAMHVNSNHRGDDRGIPLGKRVY